KLVDTVEVYGCPTKVSLEPNNGQPDYCIECLLKITIRCTWCGEPIFPDSPITLYSASDKTFEPPKHAVYYWDGKRRCFVGCMRFNCAESGADRAGFWVPPGVVKRVASPLELALSSGSTVVVSDLSDQNEEPTLIPVEKIGE
ncbi:MAG: hypothetical protein WCV58_02920, partial [Patescibacteria group bacterium]